MRRFGLVIGAFALAGCQTLNSVVGSGSDAKPEAAPPTAAAPAAAPGNASMKGMTGDTLRSLWGEPTLKRTEPGAEMWQYSGTGGCTLLVYLYADGVALAEAVPGGADEAAVTACAKASGKPSLKPIG